MALTQKRMLGVIAAGEEAIQRFDQLKELAERTWKSLNPTDKANGRIIELCASIAAIEISTGTRLAIAVERERAKLTIKRNERNERIRLMRDQFIQEGSKSHPLAIARGEIILQPKELQEEGFGESEELALADSSDHENVISTKEESDM